MCGIAGVIGEHSNDELKILSLSLKHRGPDHQSVVSLNQNKIGLVHNRLSIIDLNERANQPLFNKAKTVALIFNGEIYNYKFLKKTELKNETFETESDTEVVLKLYEKEGLNFLNKLSGMFAFALIDLSINTTFLVRDRYGIKPLYYAQDLRDRLIFSSEAQSIIKMPTIQKKLNLNAVSNYLHWGSVMGEQTLFEGVKALAPGEVLTFKNKTIFLETWVKNESQEHKNISKLEAHKIFDQALICAVERHLVSDVPVGLFLSGGLDSSLLLYKMNELGQKNINTFSVRFKAMGGTEDEFNLAQDLSKKFKTHHHEVNLGEEIVKEKMDTFFKAQDQPSIDGLNTFLVSEFAARFVKVVLSGLGGDEVLGGYPHYGYLKILSVLGARETKIKKAYEHFKTVLSPNEMSQVMNENVGCQNILENIKFTHKNIYLNISDLDFNVYLKNTLLKDSDVFSMRFGLELRVPFLDPQFVDTVRSMPQHVFQMWGKKKKIIRETYKNFLPQEILNKKKSGFVLPLGSWLQTSLRQSVEKKLNQKNIDRYGVLNFKEVEEIKNRFMHSNNPNQTYQKLWSLVVLQNFLEKHF